MAVSVDLSTDLEARLRELAAREGVDLCEYLVAVLYAHVQQAERPGSVTTSREAGSFQAVTDLELPSGTWGRYQALAARRRAGVLTDAEHQELIRLSDQVEAANIRRVENLIALARDRGVALDQLMCDLAAPPQHPKG